MKSTSTMLKLQSIYNRVSFNVINFIGQRRTIESSIESPINSHCKFENQMEVINNSNKIGMKMFSVINMTENDCKKMIEQLISYLLV